MHINDLRASEIMSGYDDLRNDYPEMTPSQEVAFVEIINVAESTEEPIELIGVDAFPSYRGQVSVIVVTGAIGGDVSERKVRHIIIGKKGKMTLLNPLTINGLGNSTHKPVTGSTALTHPCV